MFNIQTRREVGPPTIPNGREELMANHRSGLFVDEMVASLKESLATLEHRTREMLQTTWDGIILHAQSDGMAEYAEGKDPRDVEISLRDVSAAFGRLHAKAPFRNKLTMIRSLGVEKTRDLVGRFGPLVIETYGARPEMMNTLVNSAPMRVLEHVLTAFNPQAELEEIEAYVRAVGKLEEEEGGALVLRHCPWPRPEPVPPPLRVPGAVSASERPRRAREGTGQRTAAERQESTLQSPSEVSWEHGQQDQRRIFGESVRRPHVSADIVPVAEFDFDREREDVCIRLGDCCLDLHPLAHHLGVAAVLEFDPLRG